MRKGNCARLVFDRKGHLVAIATGSDATSEHEWGSKRLMEALCEQYAIEATLIDKIKAGEEVTFPPLMDVKRITRFPSGLQFEETPESFGTEPEAILGYLESPMGFKFFINELMFPTIVGEDDDPNVAGAWDERSFAIRVRGKKYVKALKEFHEAILAKHVIFASTFFKRKDMPRLSGVVLANSLYFRGEDLAAMQQVESKYNRTLRLKALDESREITQKVRKLLGMNDIGDIRARTFDGFTQEVLYSFDAKSELNVRREDYFTKNELLRWANSKGCSRLMNQGERRLHCTRT